MIKVNLLNKPNENETLLKERDRLKQYLFINEKNLMELRKKKYNGSYKKYSFRSLKNLDENFYNAIFTNFKNKCAYCETYIEINGFYIDHFKPKSLYPQDAYEFENLLPVCATCNMSKRNLFPISNEDGSYELINPIIDYPQSHLKFIEDGTIIPISKKGYVTINLLNLNREELIIKRREYYDFLQKKKNKLSEIMQYGNYTHSAVLRTFVFNEYSIENLFKYINKSFYREVFFKSLRINDNISNEDFYKLYNSYRSPDKITEEIYITNAEENQIDLQYIKKLSVKNLNGLNFNYNFNFSGKTPFLMILGENGTGKTSLLQAIVLSTIDNLNLSKNFMKKFEQSNVKISYKSVEGSKHLEELANNENNIKNNVMVNFPIAAYGSIRLLDNNKEIEFSEHLNVNNIFTINNDSYFLPKIDTWLQKEHIGAIQETLIEILPKKSGESFYLVHDEKTNEFLITFDTNKYFKFIELSSGYKTIVGLVMDIMRFLLSYPNNSGRYTPAIILIDEIDVHLHPSWKIKVVDLFRNTFPYVQFIMTTHDPLCLRGLDQNEIIVFQNQTIENKTNVITENIPFQGNLKIDQILTSDLFGLNSTLDPLHESELDQDYKDKKFRYYGYSIKEQIALEIIDNAIKNKSINLNEDISKLDKNIKDEVLKLWGIND